MLVFVDVVVHFRVLLLLRASMSMRVGVEMMASVCDGMDGHVNIVGMQRP